VILIALLLLLLGLTALLAAVFLRRASGVPAGQIIFDDAGNWQRNEKPLFSTRYRLTGKPDYLVREGKQVIPVEVKSTSLRGRKPYSSHIMQLAVYCLLVEDVMGVRPGYGILKYANTTVRITYSDDLRADLLAILRDIRRARSEKYIPRSHSEPKRCRFCGYRDVCGEDLLS